MKKITAIYARQSIDKTDSVSIETQIDDCKRKLRSGTITEVYEDKGFSGKNTNRPQLQKLLNDIRLGKVKKVIVYRLDRISRNLVDFYNLKQLMDENNCSFVSASEDFDTTSSMGRAMMNILAVFAQMERENIQQRVKDNYYYRIKDGRWAGGPAPIGFKNVRIDGFPTLEPIEDEIDIVKMIFSKYLLKNNGLNTVAKEINAWGSRTKKGTNFDNVTIRRILNNPIYVIADETLYKYFELNNYNILNDKEEFNGEYSCSLVGKSKTTSDGHHPTEKNEQTVYITRVKGFIKSVDFIKAQNKMKDNKQIAGAGRDGTRLEEFAGKFKCASCGYAIKAFSIRPTDNMPYLSCYGARVRKACPNPPKGLKFDVLKEKIGIEIQKQIDSLEDIYNKEQEIINNKRAELEEIEAKINNLISFIEKGEASELVEKRIRELEVARNQKALDIDIASSAIYDVDLLIKLKAIKTGNKIVYDKLTPKQKKETVQLLIDKVLIKSTNEIEIIWKF